MRKWVKRLLLVSLLLLLVAVTVLYGGFRMLRGTPEWYRRSTATLAQREAAARRAFNKFASILNAAALSRRNEIVARNARSSSTSRSTDRAAASTITVSFTDDELNAFFEKWSNYENWKSNYDHYIDDPVVILQPNHIILAAKAKDLDTLVSVHLEPRLDEQGRLDLRLVQILGGRLSLPDAIVSPYEHRAVAALEDRLPRWREGAAIEPSGAANGNLIAASLSRLLIHTMEHTPADPILFLPIMDRGSNVPVRVSGVNIAEHNLTITVEPLDAAARGALLQRIHNDDPTATAAAR